MATPAFDLLLEQVDNLGGLDAHNRSEFVVSAVADSAGAVHVLSKFGDRVWDLTPAIPNPNVPPHKKVVEWPQGWPGTIVDDIKSALYCWMRKGRDGMKPAAATSVVNTFLASAALIRSMIERDLETFADLTPIQIATFIQQSKDDGIQRMGLYRRLLILDLVWAFKEDLVAPLEFYPWGEFSLDFVSGLRGPRRRQDPDAEVGKTPIIPRDVQATIFTYCMRVVERAPELFRLRDEEGVSPRSLDLVEVRDACLYLFSITTGMRNDEAIGVRNGAGRTEVINGVTYRWVQAEERKTGKGLVDYLAPELTLRVLKVAEQYAAPLQQILREQIANDMRALDCELEPQERARQVSQIEFAKSNLDRVFLAFGHKQGIVRPLTRGGVACALKSLARAAGVRWSLSAHQCRRTYARMIVESSMGRIALLFVKEQFKHSSLTMTQRYALNPNQDASLMEEMLQESVALRQELLDGWAHDERLSGGAGRRMLEARAATVRNRELLLTKTAEAITIRATGHGWCIAQDGGCGGGGLYDATNCVDCKSGVIDSEWQHIWVGIYRQHKELCADDLGRGAADRAVRIAATARRVLIELGVADEAEADAS